MHYSIKNILHIIYIKYIKIYLFTFPPICPNITVQLLLVKNIIHNKNYIKLQITNYKLKPVCPTPLPGTDWFVEKVNRGIISSWYCCFGFYHAWPIIMVGVCFLWRTDNECQNFYIIMFIIVCLFHLNLLKFDIQNIIGCRWINQYHITNTHNFILQQIC